MLFDPFYRRRYKTDTSGYISPAPRWSVFQFQDGPHRYQIPDATPDAVQVNTDVLL